MKIKTYSGLRITDRRRVRRKITGAAIVVFIILAAVFVIGKLTENSAEYQLRASLVEENRALREQVAELSERISELEGTISEQEAYIASMPETQTETEETYTEQPTANSSFTQSTPRSY